MLAISGPTVFPGYVVDRGPDGPVLDGLGKLRDGWLDTGDLARVDDDGFVHLAGRAKDLIIRGGHNIDPAVIENALLAHPAVTAAQAVGRPDVHAGEVPVAFVTLAPGADTTPEELRAWAADHVPEQAAAPKAVTVLDALPVTHVGKPFKPALRAEATREAVAEALRGVPRRHRRPRSRRGRRGRRRRRPGPRRRRDLGQGSTLDRFAITWQIGDSHERNHPILAERPRRRLRGAGRGEARRRAGHARQGRARRLQRRGVPADRRAWRSSPSSACSSGHSSR